MVCFRRVRGLLFHILPKVFFPQTAIAIGVLTSNRGEGDEPLWRIGRGTRVPLQGAADVVPLLGAIVGYHCSVLWLGGRVTTNFNFGGMDVVPLLGAIAGCHCSVLWCGEGRVTTNFGGEDVVPLLGAIVGCHCSVLWVRWRVTTNLGGVDVVPLLGAIAGCQFLFHIFLLYSGPPISRRRPRKQQ